MSVMMAGCLGIWTGSIGSDVGGVEGVERGRMEDGLRSGWKDVGGVRLSARGRGGMVGLYLALGLVIALLLAAAKRALSIVSHFRSSSLQEGVLRQASGEVVRMTTRPQLAAVHSTTCGKSPTSGDHRDSDITQIAATPTLLRTPSSSSSTDSITVDTPPRSHPPSPLSPLTSMLSISERLSCQRDESMHTQ